MRQCRFARAISQAFGQSSVTGDARHQTHMAVSLGQHQWQHLIQQQQRAGVVDRHMGLHAAQIVSRGRLRVVVARAINDGVNAMLRLQLLGGLAHRSCVGDVQGQSQRTRVGVYKGLQQLGLASRHTYFRACCMQGMRAGQANAAGSAQQPDTAPAPVGDGFIERGEPSHGYQARRVNDKVTSPKKMPNLDMAALLSMTLSSSKYIQSSNCTCQT